MKLIVQHFGNQSKFTLVDNLGKPLVSLINSTWTTEQVEHQLYQALNDNNRCKKQF
jgi:hypothetical protein